MRDEASEDSEAPATMNSNAQPPELASEISGQRKVLSTNHGDIRKAKGYIVCLEQRRMFNPRGRGYPYL
jgi:hypothetical protein